MTEIGYRFVGISRTLLALLLATLPCMAVDIGWPLCGEDRDDAYLGVEVMYQSLDRNYELTTDYIDFSYQSDYSGQLVLNASDLDDFPYSTDSAIVLTTSSDEYILLTNMTGTVIKNFTRSANLDEKAFSVRITPFAGERASFFADIGTVDDPEADSNPIMIGLGARTVLLESDAIRFVAGASAHMVPSFDLAETTVTSTSSELTTLRIRNGQAELATSQGQTLTTTSSGKMKYNQFGANIIASSNFDFMDDGKLMPYAGLMMSLLRGTKDANETRVLSNDDTVWYTHTQSSGSNISEKSPLSAIVGIMAILPVDEMLVTLRVEGSFIEDSSFSASVGMVF